MSNKLTIRTFWEITTNEQETFWEFTTNEKQTQPSNFLRIYDEWATNKTDELFEYLRWMSNKFILRTLWEFTSTGQQIQPSNLLVIYDERATNSITKHESLRWMGKNRPSNFLRICDVWQQIQPSKSLRMYNHKFNLRTVSKTTNT